MPDVTDGELEQVDRANASGLTPVVFVHGLWLLPSSWDRWRTVFEEAGYATNTPRCSPTSRWATSRTTSRRSWGS